MGFDSMRMNSGRCPPLLLGALLLLCLILTCSWWSLSTQNYDLLKQLDDVTDQMRLCFNDRDTCSSAKSTLEARMKNSENEIGQLNVRIQTMQSKNEETINELHSKKELLKSEETKKEGLESDLKICKTELESLKSVDHSMSETLKAVRNEINEKKEEIKVLQAKIVELEKNQIVENEVDKKEVVNNNPPVGETHEGQNSQDKKEAEIEPNEEVQESPRFDQTGGKED